MTGLFPQLLPPSPLGQLKKMCNEIYYKNLGAKKRREAERELARLPKPIYKWNPSGEESVITGEGEEFGDFGFGDGIIK